MTHLTELVAELNALLEPQRFNDYCPNGLQVEGKSEVRFIISGVTASQALIDQAIIKKADAILVHHGYFWKNENPCVTGMKKTRLQKLLAHDISLIAYHLPLDVHPELGNNVQLGIRLGIKTEKVLDPVNPKRVIGLIGTLAEPISGDAFSSRIQQVLGRAPFYIPGKRQEIKTIAWCTGAGQSFIEQAVAQQVDAYLTGEVSEPTVHVAQETGLHFFAAGHHVTERYGVCAVGDYLAKKFNIRHEFVDIYNPI